MRLRPAQRKMPGQKSYVVVGNRQGGYGAGELHSWLQEIASDSRITVRRISGEPPTRLQIEASDDAVEQLRSRYGDRVIIELDAPLNPLN